MSDYGRPATVGTNGRPGHDYLGTGTGWTVREIWCDSSSLPPLFQVRTPCLTP